MVISVNRRLFRYFGSYSGISVIPVIPVILVGNGSFRSYPVRTPGRFGPIPFRSGRFGPGRFGPISGVSCFGPILVGRFGPLYFSIVFR